MRNGEDMIIHDRKTQIALRILKCKRWVESHFLNFRALKQAQNIKSQIQELIRKVDVKVCEKFLMSDPLYQQYQEKKKDKDKDKSSKKDGESLSRYERVRMALTSGNIIYL